MSACDDIISEMNRHTRLVCKLSVNYITCIWLRRESRALQFQAAADYDSEEVILTLDQTGP